MSEVSRTTFQIVVEGIELPAETVDRIDRVLQQAALVEVATIDLRGNELAFRPIMRQLLDADGDDGDGGGGGRGGGAHVIVAEPR
ncbi:hypothetical protein IU459_23220 [Nocardia amamiensis]|uniref:Uncharacterized protein n=1 Tax=Nocardia amamiensis TaxID=404578 RepID=A0ABS0D026_9NOCA|nr:hypothetical protein [Nocardia amamiensis]MBF6300433.1 hypothetical protein [Nocardia amamiensis]